MKRITFIKDIKLMVVIYEPGLTGDTFLVTCSKQKMKTLSKRRKNIRAFFIRIFNGCSIHVFNYLKTTYPHGCSYHYSNYIWFNRWFC